MQKKVILIILDGWGIAPSREGSAILQAKTPFLDSLFQQYPHSQLVASGPAVGLPEGQMGNSEVGHMHIGAGRVIPQTLVTINSAIQSNRLGNHKGLLEALAYAKQNHKKVHLMGLLSNGGVHSHIDHLKALCTIAKKEALDALFIHAFTDGRDTAPYSAINFLEEITQHMEQTRGKLASIMGRYYAMDRDKRWERTQVAYDALVHGIGDKVVHWKEGVQHAYQEGISDEFLPPLLLCTNANHMPLATIGGGDVVLCFNFRPDRSQQITQMLTQGGMQVGNRPPISIQYLSMVPYQEGTNTIPTLFQKPILEDTLGEVLSKHGKKQVRIAETEKYAHVTYFFSGGKRDLFVEETRILCPSPQVVTYDRCPEMSISEITQQTEDALTNQQADFICVNFANPDMVGHTGILAATIQACEAVDKSLKRVVTKALKCGYTIFITADHGNADQMIHTDGKPHTAHTTNPVPFIYVNGSNEYSKLADGILTDIAPTILEVMNIAIPKAMTGRSLLYSLRPLQINFL